MKYRSRLFPIGIVLMAILSISAFADEAQWKQFSEAGKKAFEKKDYSEAEKMFDSALKEAEKFGEQDPRLPSSLNNLAETYYVQAKFALAEPLHKKALEIREKVLGPEHPDLVKSLSSLAKLYCICGKYGKAEPLYKRALKIITGQSINPENAGITQSLNTLADLYRKQGRYKDGELIYKSVSEK